MDARRRVGRARAARDEADARPSRDLADRLRHHRRTAFVTADGHGDAAVAQRIQHGEKTLAGNAEHMLDAVDHELLDQRRGGGSARCVLVHRISLRIVLRPSLTRWQRVQGPYSTSSVSVRSARRGRCGPLKYLRPRAREKMPARPATGPLASRMTEILPCRISARPIAPAHSTNRRCRGNRSAASPAARSSRGGCASAAG